MARKTRRWTLENLIDFEQTLASEKLDTTSSTRTAVAAAVKGRTGSDARRAGLLAWLEQARGKSSMGRKFTSVLALIGAGLTIFMWFAGVSAALGMLDPVRGGINVTWFLGALIGGQRGLDFLEQMQRATDIQITVHDSRIASEESSNHTRLIETSRLLGARIMTVDDNLSKVAKLQGIEVLNITELDDALKPNATVGDKVRITLVRNGKEIHQAVGYLANGTMIVVNHSAEKIGSAVDATVVSTLQTSAGTMVFAELLPSG